MMSEEFLQMLVEARILANIPFVPVSYFRCPVHNINIGSTSNNHPRGEAGDIACHNSRQRHIMVNAFLGVGFNRIGIHRSFLHIDINPTQIPNVVWLY